jgi:hypothetical protein
MRWAKSGAEAAARLAAPELADGWAKPASLPAEVWRERAFEVVLDGGRGTGVFDRVVVERDGSGRAGRAPVFDSEFDRVERGGDLGAAAAPHAGRWELYRRVVARLAGMVPWWSHARCASRGCSVAWRSHFARGGGATGGHGEIRALQRGARSARCSLLFMGNLKKKRRLKMNKHKRRKRLKSHRHKKRSWQQ